MKSENNDILRSLCDEISLYLSKITEYQTWFKEVDIQLSLSDKAYMQSIFNEYKKQKPIFQIMQNNIKNNNIEEDAVEYAIYLQKITSRRLEQEEQINKMKERL